MTLPLCLLLDHVTKLFLFYGFLIFESIDIVEH